MNQASNRFTLLLMLSSIALLLALQVFWLMNSYEKAYFDLRKDANGIFRNTILAMRDSMLIKQIQHIDGDSLPPNDMVFMRKRSPNPADSGKDKNVFRFKRNSTQVQIYVQSDQKVDSLQKILTPFISRAHEGRYNGGANFLVRIGPDSLSVDSIVLQFTEALSKSYRSLPFKIRHTSILPPIAGNIRTPYPPFGELPDGATEPGAFSNDIQTEWVSVDPIHRYAAVLSEFRPILVKEISPQILFSIFLTLLTTGSFVVIYRNLRAQQRLMILKNDFISNVTHELKTPIATVSVALEALRNFKGMENPQLTREYLDIAQQELKRLAMLADKALTTSLFDDHGVKIELEAVDLQELVESVLASMKLVFEKQQAVVQFEKTGSDFTLRGNAVHLTNVVHNLLDNGLKYSPSSPQLTISLRDLGEKLTLSFQDNGLGIPGEYHKKIFEKFFRMPTGDVHNIKGHGLGLSYVEGVVKAHGGSIEVKSEVGRGSTFTISLPK